MNLSLFHLFSPLHRCFDADIVKDNFLSKRVISCVRRQKERKKKGRNLFSHALDKFLYTFSFWNVVLPRRAARLVYVNVDDTQWQSKNYVRRVCWKINLSEVGNSRNSKENSIFRTNLSEFINEPFTIG